MKTTNEIQRQLELKANKYIEEKAKEMFEIHREIARYLGDNLPNYIDYITDLGKYKSEIQAERNKHFNSSSPSAIEHKYQIELHKTYKERIVRKYTKELLAKMEIF